MVSAVVRVDDSVQTQPGRQVDDNAEYPALPFGWLNGDVLCIQLTAVSLSIYFCNVSLHLRAFANKFPEIYLDDFG